MHKKSGGFDLAAIGPSRRSAFQANLQGSETLGEMLIVVGIHMNLKCGSRVTLVLPVYVRSLWT